MEEIIGFVGFVKELEKVIRGFKRWSEKRFGSDCCDEDDEE